jgi:hypothetical protein
MANELPLVLIVLFYCLIDPPTLRTYLCALVAVAGVHFFLNNRFLLVERARQRVAYPRPWGISIPMTTTTSPTAVTISNGSMVEIVTDTEVGASDEANMSSSSVKANDELAPTEHDSDKGADTGTETADPVKGQLPIFSDDI